jgi:uncharacterized membrane protein (UPF0127 family)
VAQPHFLSRLLDGSDQSYSLTNESTQEVIASRVEPAFDSQTRRRGLLGRDDLSPEIAFVIAPTNAVHTFGMRFPIDLLFVARSGKVVKRVVALKRGRIAAALRAFAVIEFHANHPGVAATKVGDRLKVTPAAPRTPPRHG